jgi:hypothetical protein
MVIIYIGGVSGTCLFRASASASCCNQTSGQACDTTCQSMTVMAVPSIMPPNATPQSTSVCVVAVALRVDGAACAQRLWADAGVCV